MISQERLNELLNKVDRSPDVYNADGNAFIVKDKAGNFLSYDANSDKVLFTKDTCANATWYLTFVSDNDCDDLLKHFNLEDTPIMKDKLWFNPTAYHWFRFYLDKSDVPIYFPCKHTRDLLARQSDGLALDGAERISLQIMDKHPEYCDNSYRGHLFEDSEDGVLRNVPVYAPTHNGYWVVYSGRECEPLRNCSHLATDRAIAAGEPSNTPSLRFLDKAEAEQYQKDVTKYWAETHPEGSRVGYVNNIGFATVRPEPLQSKKGETIQLVKLPDVNLFDKTYTSAVLYVANYTQYKRFVDIYGDKKYKGHLFEDDKNSNSEEIEKLRRIREFVKHNSERIHVTPNDFCVITSEPSTFSTSLGVGDDCKIAGLDTNKYPCLLYEGHSYFIVAKEDAEKTLDILKKTYNTDNLFIEPIWFNGTYYVTEAKLPIAGNIEARVYLGADCFIIMGIDRILTSERSSASKCLDILNAGGIDDDTYKGHLFENNNQPYIENNEESKTGEQINEDIDSHCEKTAKLLDKFKIDNYFHPEDNNWFVIYSKYDDNTVGYDAKQNAVNWEKNILNDIDSRYLIFKSKSDAELFIRNCNKNIANYNIEALGYAATDLPVTFVPCYTSGVTVYIMFQHDYDDECFLESIPNNCILDIGDKKEYSGHLFEADSGDSKYLAAQSIRDKVIDNIKETINQFSEEKKQRILKNYTVDEICNVVDNNLCYLQAAQPNLFYSFKGANRTVFEDIACSAPINATRYPYYGGSSVLVDAEGAEASMKLFNVAEKSDLFAQDYSDEGRLYRMHLNVGGVDMYPYFEGKQYIDHNTHNRCIEHIEMIVWYLDNNFVPDTGYSGHLFEDVEDNKQSNEREIIIKQLEEALEYINNQTETLDINHDNACVFGGEPIHRGDSTLRIGIDGYIKGLNTKKDPADMNTGVSYLICKKEDADEILAELEKGSGIRGIFSHPIWFSDSDCQVIEVKPSSIPGIKKPLYVCREAIYGGVNDVIRYGLLKRCKECLSTLEGGGLTNQNYQGHLFEDGSDEALYEEFVEYVNNNYISEFEDSLYDIKDHSHNGYLFDENGKLVAPFDGKVFGEMLGLAFKTRGEAIDFAKKHNLECTGVTRQVDNGLRIRIDGDEVYIQGLELDDPVDLVGGRKQRYLNIYKTLKESGYLGDDGYKGHLFD